MHSRALIPTALIALLAAAGCSTPSEPAAAPEVKPSPSSAAPVVTFTLPEKLGKLPRSTENGWLKEAQSRETFLKAYVSSPKGGTVAAVYQDPKDLSESIHVSAAAGRVPNPPQTLGLMTRGRALDLEDVGPVEAGTCGVSKEWIKGLVTTVCDWADSGSVGWIRIISSKDQREMYADIREQLQP